MRTLLKLKMAAFPSDFNQLKAQLNKTLGDASVVVKFSCVVICLFYGLSFIPSVYSGLAVTPGSLIPPHFKIWTLITAGFVEYRIWNLTIRAHIFVLSYTNLIVAAMATRLPWKQTYSFYGHQVTMDTVVIDIFVLVLCGRYLEPLWGALEFLKFILIVDVGASLVTAFLCLILYAATFNTHIWFLQFSGMTGIVSGIMVAFKQINPDQELKISVVSFRVKQIPSIVLLLYVILCVINVLPLILLTMVVSGALIGWVYLRFFQPHGRGVKGDLSDTFSFASFFPEPVQAPVNVVSTVVFNVLIKAGICVKPVRTYDVGAPSAITISLPGMDPADAERRRQKALKALNERLNKLESNTSWPSMEDNPDRTEEDLPSPAPTEDVPEVIVDKGTPSDRLEGPSQSSDALT